MQQVHGNARNLQPTTTVSYRVLKITVKQAPRSRQKLGHEDNVRFVFQQASTSLFGRSSSIAFSRIKQSDLTARRGENVDNFLRDGFGNHAFAIDQVVVDPGGSPL